MVPLVLGERKENVLMIVYHTESEGISLRSYHSMDSREKFPPR